MNALYILESVNDPKFPYRLTIRQGDKILLALRVQDRWPGQKGNIFCMREETRSWTHPDKEIERVPVISLKRVGKRLVLVLDRAINKRCDFLFLTKKYKTKEGEYEQIFWRTQKALRERRPKVKLSPYHKGELNVVIDANERYPWNFPNSFVKKDNLPVGDYALVNEDGIIAIVERKTFDNFLSEFGRISAFHQQLTELTAYKNSALVIEANYSDFLNPDKLKFYSPTFSGKVIAELYALHPGLTIVFAGNRKLANAWTHSFFNAILAHLNDVPHNKVMEVLENYGDNQETKGGIFYDLRKFIMNELSKDFTVETLMENFPDTSQKTITKVLKDLEKEGVISKTKQSNKVTWTKNL